jgi:hypothetical protein
MGSGSLQVIGAGDGIRTRDINLGKVALYQLSYSRLEKSCYSWIQLWLAKTGFAGFRFRSMRRYTTFSNEIVRKSIHVVGRIRLKHQMRNCARLRKAPGAFLMCAHVLENNKFN